MHKIASRRGPAVQRSRAHLSVTHAARTAVPGDGAEIHALVDAFADDGLLLRRSLRDIETAISDFVVVVDRHDRVQACAALFEYSPSLAEVGAVAVSRSAQGTGLGSMAVRSVEAMARRRGVRELFALSLADRFFESLAFEPAPLASFPEKVARYEALAARGVRVTPKSCFRKHLA